MSTQNSTSKTIGFRIKDIFVTLVGLFVFSIIGLKYYSVYQFNKQNPDLYTPRPVKGEKPSKEELIRLMNDITKNLNQQSRSSYRNEGVYEGFIFLSKTYTNPNEQTLNQLENNIAQQNIWTKINSEQANTQIFCHEQIMLEKHYNRNELEKYLYISIRWDSTGECRDLHYNPDSNLAKRLLQPAN